MSSTQTSQTQIIATAESSAVEAPPAIAGGTSNTANSTLNTSGTSNTVQPEGQVRRYDLASHWQLMWWKFRKHKMAMTGLIILALMLISSLFAEFLSPYDPLKRNSRYAEGAPMGIHFFDEAGDFHLRPFVYARSLKRDPVTLKRSAVVDTSKRWPIQFFVQGNKYTMLGLIESDIHLFGVVNEKGKVSKKAFIHLLGTDELGRDMFSRILHSSRVSLSVGFIGVSVAFVLGMLLGGAAGYLGGWVDEAIMRMVEFIRAVPTLPLWLALAAALPREWSALQVYIAITFLLAIIGWTHLARRVRGRLLSLREEDFVMAARLAGCSHSRIIARHMLPSFMSYLIVDLTISFPYIIMAETSLSFLGLGLREPIISWGVLLNSAQNIQTLAQMPWLLLPGAVVVIAVLAFNFVGDGLRDAADPYTK